MPGSFKGSKPGSHLRRTRGRLDGPSRLVRLSAFREIIYSRMEEISFRSSMTVLAGVVAFAAVVAAVSILMSVSPGPAHHAALGWSPGSAAPSSALARPTRTPASPPSSPAPVRPSPVRDARSGATHAPAVTTVASAPSPSVPTPAVSPSPARMSYEAAVAAWWSWWLRVHGRRDTRAYGGGSFGGLGRDGGRSGRGGGRSGRR